VRSLIKSAPVRIRIVPNCAQNDDAIKDAKTMQSYLVQHSDSYII